MNVARSLFILATLSAGSPLGCGSSVSAEEPRQLAPAAASSGAEERPSGSSEATTAATGARTAQVGTVVASTPSAVTSAPALDPASGPTEKLIEDSVEFDFGPFPRKLTEKEREFLAVIWMLVDRQDDVVLLTKSSSKRNADAWLALLGEHLIALGVSDAKLTRVACVEPKAKRVFSQVRKSPASCADVVDTLVPSPR